MYKTNCVVAQAQRGYSSSLLLPYEMSGEEGPFTSKQQMLKSMVSDPIKEGLQAEKDKAREKTPGDDTPADHRDTEKPSGSGHQPLGSGALPNSQLLSRAGIQADNTERVEEETNRQVSLESQLEAIRGTGSDKKTGEKSQLFLAAAGLPTVTQKLAQRIWDFEMEEFLPSNRVVQALEVSGLAREGTVYQLPQSCKVTEIMSWIRCFTLYLAVMSSRRPELVAPMVAHLHTVIKLEQSMGGLGWLQYDWRARKELCAAGSTTWGKQDPRQLLACLPHASTSLDPLSPLTTSSSLGIVSIRGSPNACEICRCLTAER